MGRIGSGLLWILLITAGVATGQTTPIHSSAADFSLPGNWQAADQFASAHYGFDMFYDSATGALLQVNQQGGIVKAGDIAKFFGGANADGKFASEVLALSEFSLPTSYTDIAAKSLAKGDKPPKMWEVKDGEGNPFWFYSSQLFEQYRVKSVGGSSEVKEEYVPVRVTKAEQRTVQGGDLLVFEVETDRPANEAAMKRFHMPAGLKDQKLRYGWVQFAPGGIASGQGVLSVAFAAPVTSGLTAGMVAEAISSATIKPL